MCGIFGWVTPGSPLPLDACHDGLDTLHHRGPDGRGALVARLSDAWHVVTYDPSRAALTPLTANHPDLFFGHTRLSIIDLNPNASQPLANEDRSVWVVFNGEIYNHGELRQELLAHGHHFRTHHSDTEVLVHGYEEWGDGLVERLRGMFAFAILSLPQRQVLLARDRFGEKPLYVRSDTDGLCFASELKALFAATAVETKLSDDGLACYLAHGFIPAPTTILAGVWKLAAAECVTIDLNRPHDFRPKRYWQLKPSDPLPVAQARERFLAELSRAIRLRMESDVPLGAFLSGGLDSTVVVREMQRAADKPVKTFTIGFREQRNDESPFAAQAAARYQTSHHVETLDADEMLRILPLLEHQYDEPFADSSAIPTYLVARMARRYVTVALSGDGGDEMLCGYPYYRDLFQIGRILDRFPNWVVGAAAPLQWLWPEWLRGKGLIRYLIPGEYQRYRRYWIDHYLLQMAGIEMGVAEANLLDQWRRSPGRGTDAMAEIDSRFYVPEDIMVKVDRATMAVSLESRAPLLDHHLFEAAFALPLSERFDGRRGKLPFRSLLTSELGAQFVDRRKQGFAIPLGAWFRGPLKSMLFDSLLDWDSILLQWFPRRCLESLIQMHLTGSRDQSSRLWRLYVLHRWHQRYVRDRAHSRPESEAVAVGQLR